MKLNIIERLAAVDMILTKYLLVDDVDNLHLIKDGDYFIYHDDLDTSLINEKDQMLLESIGAYIWDSQTIELKSELERSSE